MKKIIIILFISNLFSNVLSCQTLLQQIESAYNSLDSVSYIENIIVSFRKYVEEDQKEKDDTTLELSGYDYTSIASLDSAQRQKILDSICNYIENLTSYSLGPKRLTVEEKVKEFSEETKKGIPIFVLNLISKDKQTLQVDTAELSFNLFYFNEDYTGRFFVYCSDGKFQEYDSAYMTFAKKLNKNAIKVFKKILSSNPKYLLYCYDLEQMNTILYVLNDKIFVYRIIQMQKYELNDYIEQFGIGKKYSM